MDIVPTKINLDELYTSTKMNNINTVKTFNLILDRVHTKIKIASRQKFENTCCWYVIPEFILGLPRYELNDAVAYIIHQLQENGFQIKYTHPNLVFISWNHWIPDYVRHEYKKSTGVVIDGFGKEVKQDEPKKPSIKSTSSYVPSNIIYKDDFIKLV